jgi:hypothetical protein
VPPSKFHKLYKIVDVPNFKNSSSDFHVIPQESTPLPPLK